ncbi:MAG TPA: hypothetical protein VFM98_14700 [Ramlibacter sp.]|uniref:hypothetical protein n=1 Tax=Ramlibacter sp. TaxID=1917967 RepID=UPI002D805D8B|nr:hypothetical protein [Ramlibacter sp.]HET8746854.1 hypothetical protein [Ramlibacter sp.]
MVSLLAACGGGGGGGSDEPAPVATQLTITSNNQQAVSAEAVQVAEGSSMVADLGGSVVTGVQVSAASVLPGPVLLGGVALKLLSMAPAAPAMATGVTETVSETCSGGGSATVKMTSSSPSAVVPGDAVSITANNCVETINGSTVRLNGSLSLEIAAGSFDPDSVVYPKDLTLHMTAGNFTMDTVTLSGSMDLRLVQTSAMFGSVTLTAPSMSWKDAALNDTHRVTLKNYTHHVEHTTVDTSRIQVTGTVETDSVRIGAGLVSFDLNTPEPIVVNTLFGGMVIGGSLQVTGKNSGLLLTVVGNDTFELKLDANGDGTPEATSTVTRAQLRTLR